MYGAILTLVLTLFGHLDAQTYNDSVDLRTSVLSNYNAKERPVLHLNSTVDVYAYFELVSIQDIDAVSGSLTVTGFLVLSWIDEKLRWERNSYGGLYNVYFGINEIWHPNLVLQTTSKALNSFTADWMSIRVYSDGTTYHFPSGEFSTICNINIRYYPFDRQVCTANFKVFAFLGHEVAIYATFSEIQKNYFINSNGEWDLESTKVEAVLNDSRLDSYELKLQFTLKRRSDYLVVNVLLPIIFLAYINILVFVIPAECGERVGYAITVLLSLVVFLTLVNNTLPNSSEPMSIFGYYIMFMLILSNCMVVVTTVNLKLYFKQGSVPGWCENMVLCYRRNGKGYSHSGNNQVSPSEEMKDEEIVAESNLNIEKAEEVSAPHVTWQDFSYAIDAIFLVVFFVIITLTNIIVFAILASN